MQAYVAGQWVELPFELHPAVAITLGVVPVEHPEFGEVWIVPRAHPLRVDELVGVSTSGRAG